MTANPPLRATLWLGLTAVAGVAGWVGGRAAKEGLDPDSRAVRYSPSPSPAIGGPLEPRVEPGTPGGNWMTRVKAAESGDFAALVEELDTLLPKEGHSAERDAAQKWLLAFWISKDLDAALAYVAGKQDKFLGNTFGLLLGSLAPDKVSAILAGPHKSELGEYFPAAALRSLAASDPRAFLKLDAKDLGTAWSRHWPRALASLAETDPAERGRGTRRASVFQDSGLLRRRCFG